ncbi:MAG: murein L,D-transpeptidase catalytic domain family protein [Verrucomicrobiales bacterium]|nr:murein L,D-transpeptidase catalytic domain family protein [Verrucomicrobiales bacterium]
MPEPRSFVTPLFTSALSLSLVFTIGCTSPVVSPSALSLAQQRLAREVGTVPKKGTLVVVDYTKPSSEKRMTVIDLKTGRARMNSLVAHGVNSGLVYAQSFSDEVGSEKSSLGLYRVGEEYMGKHGPSLRLDGLDRGFNLNARKRGIVVHSASYVSKETMHENRHEYGRIGRSQGCLALNEKDLVKLDRKMQRPAYVFAYAPTLLAQGAYPPLNPAPPQPVLAQADNPAPTRKPTTPVVASAPAPAQKAPAPAPAAVDLPAIPRPTQVETGPVALGDAPAQTGFYTVSGRAPVQ